MSENGMPDESYFAAIAATDGGVDAAAEIEFALERKLTEPSGEWALRALADVHPRQVRWLVPGLIPLRALTLVAGVGGLGKSTWLLAQAAELSREEISTIVVSFEDTAAEVIRPRLEAAGADLAQVFDVVLRGGGIDTVQLPRDLEPLQALMQTVDARLIVFDPVVAALETSVDAHKDQHVRAVLSQLAATVEERDAAGVLVGHLNKTPSTDAYIRVANSVAFWNACRSVVLITEDAGDDETLRLVAQRKANWARLRPVERHRLEEIVLPGTLDLETGEPIVTSRMSFVEVADDFDGADVLGPKRTKTETAETVLAAILADGDWHESNDVKRVMDAANFKQRTLQRAMKYLGVQIERRGFPSQTVWRIPLDGATAAPVAPTAVAPSTSPKDGGTVDSAQPSRSDAPAASVAPSSAGRHDCGPENPDLLDAAEEQRLRAKHADLFSSNEGRR